MAAPRKATDAAIVKALAGSSSIAEAARRIGMTADGLRKRLAASPEIRIAFNEAVGLNLRIELRQVADKTREMLDLLERLAREGGPRDSVKLGAACKWLDYAIKLFATDEPVKEEEKPAEDWTLPEFPVQRQTFPTAAPPKDAPLDA